MEKECKVFGNFDPMDGGCDYCYHDNRELFDKCFAFRHSKPKGTVYIIPTYDKPVKVCFLNDNEEVSLPIKPTIEEKFRALGIEIVDKNKNYKGTYEIINELSKIYHEKD